MKPRTSTLDLVRIKCWIKERENSFNYHSTNGLEMPKMNRKFNFYLSKSVRLQSLI